MSNEQEQKQMSPMEAAPQLEQEPQPEPQCGTLKVMGHIDLHDDDEGPQRYERALLIQFPSEESIRQAIADGRCSFKWGE